jgi:hypothetical protein
MFKIYHGLPMFQKVKCCHKLKIYIFKFSTFLPFNTNCIIDSKPYVTWISFFFNVGFQNSSNIHPLSLLDKQSKMSASWLHMLGGRGTFGSQCDFFIGIVNTLHYFELGFWHPRKQLGSIK